MTANKQPSGGELVWSDQLPTAPGWYFWRPGETTEPIFRKRLPEGVYRLEMCGLPGHVKLHLALPKSRSRYPAEWMAGQWAGPIPEPVETA